MRITPTFLGAMILLAAVAPRAVSAAECSGPAVLYDRGVDPLAAGTVPGQDVPPLGDGGPDDSEVADDFEVPADTVWFVGSVRATVQTLPSTGGPPAAVNVAILLDDGGRPGAAVCSFAALPPQVRLGPDAQGRTVIGVNLPSPCTLCAGTRYWLSLQAADPWPRTFTWLQRSSQHLSPARWRSPGGGPLGTCAAWGTFGACGVGDGVSPDLDVSLEGVYQERSAYVRGDFDGDRCPDLLFQNAQLTQVLVWRMAGLTRVGELTLAVPPSWELPIVAMEDFDGDGRSDLLLGGLAMGRWAIWYLAQDDEPQELEPPDFGLEPHWLMGSGRFTGGPEPDGLCQGGEPGSIKIWQDLASTGLTRGTSPPKPTGEGWRFRAVADFDGDGLDDLVFWAPTTAALQIVLMKPELVAGPDDPPAPPGAATSNWELRCAADFGIGPAAAGSPAPACGAADLVWQNTTSGNVSVWFMDRNGSRTNGLFTSPPSPGAGWKLIGASW